MIQLFLTSLGFLRLLTSKLDYSTGGTKISSSVPQKMLKGHSMKDHRVRWLRSLMSKLSAQRTGGAHVGPDATLYDLIFWNALVLASNIKNVPLLIKAPMWLSMVRRHAFSPVREGPRHKMSPEVVSMQKS